MNIHHRDDVLGFTHKTLVPSCSSKGEVDVTLTSMSGCRSGNNTSFTATVDDLDSRMRLLKLNDDGRYSLEQFHKDNLPAYAILSHTWGRGTDDEVTYNDIADGTGNNKPGFKKLEFCHKQAKLDDLHYFWVDTCCIDKSNDKELGTAINSMFRWYQNAERCYVYLPDVSVQMQNGQARHVDWNSAFRNSRWFTRGWTLQELLAPKIVEFYSRDHIRLGDKTSLEQDIHETTGIAVEALRGRHLRDFSVDERLRWREKRKTTEEEDQAYCLLGIFGVSMPLIYGEGQARAMKRLRREVTEPGQSGSQSLGDAVEYATDFSLEGVPRAKSFVDRPSEIAEIERALLPPRQTQRQSIFVLRGLGGIGKTQLAVEFARRHHPKFGSVFWLDGTSEDSLKRSIARCASRIAKGQISDASRAYFSSKEDGDLDSVVTEVMGWLAHPRNTEWLLIYDNVDREYGRQNPDPSAYDVRRYFPGGDHGSILITTRLARLEQLGASQHVNKVDRIQAQAILESWYKKKHDHAESEQLLSHLDGLPLAIAQAGAYLQETAIGIRTYLELYEQEWKELMESRDETEEPVQDYPNRSVWTTWAISFHAIREKDKAAAKLLLLWSFLDNKDLWHGLFTAACKASADTARLLTEWIGEIASSKLRFFQAIRLLRNYSLVEGNDDVPGYATHPVVHKWAYHYQSQEGRRKVACLSVSVIGSAVPDISTREHSTLQRRLLPHAQACTEWVVAYNLGQSAHSHGQSELRSGRAEDRRVLLDAIHNLGMLYADQCKLSDAEKMYTRALQGRQEVLGLKHPSTLTTVNKLGHLYFIQGKLDESEKMYMRALQGQEEVLGLKHPSTLTTVNKLGHLYIIQGKLDESEKMYLQALQGQEEVLGLKHTSTLNTVSNLGGLYQDQGKLDEAEKMYLQALQGQEEVLGLKHTLTLHTVHNLGVLYKSQGKLDEAEKMYLQALQGQEEVLGLKHTSTLSTVGNLGNLYNNQGKLDEAEKMYLQALQGQEEVLGLKHTSTLNTVNNLGVLYQNQGKLNEAEKMYLQALQGQEEVLGLKHTSIFNTVGNLGGLYQDQGKLDEAEKMYLQALQGKEEVLGLKHTSTLTTIHNLGILYNNQGKLDEAEKMHLRALQGQEEVLGSKHNSTLNTIYNLADLYKNQDRLDEAEKLYIKVLQGYKEVLGPKHTSTLKTVNSLGILYKSQDKLDEAERMHMQELPGYKEAIAKHPSTLNTVHSLNKVEKSEISKPTSKSEASSSETLVSSGKTMVLSWAVAIYNLPLSFSKQSNAVYLRYEIGDVVTVERKDNSGWWFARLTNTKSAGWIASNYFIDLQPRHLNGAPLVQLQGELKPKSKKEAIEEAIKEVT